MTGILAGAGTNFPQNQKGYMPPIPAYFSVAVKKSKNASQHRFADDSNYDTKLLSTQNRDKSEKKRRRRSKKNLTVIYPHTKSLNASKRHIES